MVTRIGAFDRKNIRGVNIVTDFVSYEELGLIFRGMQPQNRLACEWAFATGWRISDVLNLKTSDIKKAIEESEEESTTIKLEIIEQKTGKNSIREVEKDLALYTMLFRGNEYLFAGKGGDKPRTRQAVYSDFKKAAGKIIQDSRNISIHSLRKAYALYLAAETNKIEEVQKKLNHRYDTTTARYLIAGLKYLLKQHKREESGSGEKH